MLCVCPVQVLASVLMCLLDWLMVIPVSKLLSKTNEDENVSILARVFQVIIYLFRDWEKGLPLTHSGVVRDWAENSHWWPCTISLVVSYARKLKAICSQWGAVQGHIYHSVISLVKETLRQRWGEEKTKISREASLSKVIQSLTHCCFCHLFCLVRCWRWLRQTKDPRKEPNSWTYPPLSVVTVGQSDWDDYRKATECQALYQAALVRLSQTVEKTAI